MTPPAVDDADAVTVTMTVIMAVTVTRLLRLYIPRLYEWVTVTVTMSVCSAYITCGFIYG